MKAKLKYFNEQDYELLKDTGYFWEFYPEATGIFEQDKQMSIDNKFKIEQE